MASLDQLDLPLLIAFEALLREGNITRSALSLGITQPAMSARLTRLKKVFGDPLFVPARTGRGVVPTPRALALAPALAETLDALRRLLNSEGGFDPATTDRTFVVAMLDNPAMMMGAGLVSGLSIFAPNSRLALVTTDQNQIHDDLEKGRVDILVGNTAAADQGLITRKLLTERFAVAQRKHHPRGLDAIDLDQYCSLNHLVVSVDGGGFSSSVDELLADLGRSRRVVTSVQSYALAPFVIEKTDLVCTLPKPLFTRFDKTLDLFDPPINLGTISLSIIWHPRSQEDAGHVWLRGQLLKAAGAVSY